MKTVVTDTSLIDTSGIKALFEPINHIFTNHLLPNTNKFVVPLNKVEEYWPVFLFTLSLSLIILIRITSPKKFFILLKSFFSFNAAKQLIREDYRLNKGSSLILISLFLMNFPFLLYKINANYHFYPYTFSSFNFYVLTVFLVGLVYGCKLLSLKIIGLITNNYALSEEYIYYSFLSIKASGLFLFPVLIFLEYAKLPVMPFVLLGLLIFLVFYSVRIVRGLMILFNSETVSIFHLFLYLCALEIIPLIVLIKILISGFKVFG